MTVVDCEFKGQEFGQILFEVLPYIVNTLGANKILVLDDMDNTSTRHKVLQKEDAY